MTGIEKITSRILEDAKSEVNVTLETAKAQADEITKKYNAQAEQEYSELISRGETVANEHEEHLKSNAQMDSRKMILSVKQEMLDYAFAAAKTKLCSLPDEQMAAVLAKIAMQASSSGKEEVVLNAENRKRIGKAVVEKANAAGKLSLTLSSEIGTFDGGLLLNDGDVEVNCTFETLVRLARNDISGQIASVLFN